jgi:hypothetical protein
MNTLLGYWLIGCVLVGLSIAHFHERCPNDDIGNAVDWVATVAVWPVSLAAVIYSPGATYHTECKVLK